MNEKADSGPSERTLEVVGLLAILFLAFAIRLQQIDTLLPWFIYEDETRMTDIGSYLLNNRTLNTSYTYYPAFSFYINSVVYFFITVIGQMTEFMRPEPDAVWDNLLKLKPEDPRFLMVSRWVSLVFALASIVLAYLLGKLYLTWRWALFATLLFALNHTHVSMSILAKVDSINLFWWLAGIYTIVLYYRKGGLKWLAAAAICTGLLLVVKNNFLLMLSLGIVIFLRSPFEAGGLRGFLLSRQLWIGGIIFTAAAVMGSPYSFIHLDKTLQDVGWLYAQSEVISTYHTDPHVWWLDRYHYMYIIVMPFVAGLPIFWLAVAGSIQHVRRHFMEEPFIFLNLIFFFYWLSSNAGGPAGGAMPYYLWMVMIPLMMIIGVRLLHSMIQSEKRMARSTGYALCVLVFVWSLVSFDNHWRMFFSGYDKLGPWIHEKVEPDKRLLMLSVYKPGAALSDLQVKSVWAHEFKQGVESFDPDFIVIDTWAVAGFRKVYRDLGVAPYVDSCLSGERGYKEVYRHRVDYWGRSYFVWLDIEHDVEIIVLERTDSASRHD